MGFIRKGIRVHWLPFRQGLSYKKTVRGHFTMALFVVPIGDVRERSPIRIIRIMDLSVSTQLDMLHGQDEE